MSKTMREPQASRKKRQITLLQTADFISVNRGQKTRSSRFSVVSKAEFYTELDCHSRIRMRRLFCLFCINECLPLK